jgi:predicted NBD/HSP70 family sugar kinase
MSDVVTTVGIDIGKTTFHLIGFDGRGAIVLRQKVSRAQLERRFAALPPCLVGTWRPAAAPTTSAGSWPRSGTRCG